VHTPKKCPKCGNELEKTVLSSLIHIKKKGDFVGDLIVPYLCRNCGFIEFYDWEYVPH